MATTTVATRTTVVKGAGTLVSHAAVVAATVHGRYSLHDCDDPTKVALHNCIWPVNIASPDGLKFKAGLTVHNREPGGTVSVTTA